MDAEPLEYSLIQVNGSPLWRTSFSMHFKPNIHKFTPSIFLCEASEMSLNSEKKINK